MTRPVLPPASPHASAVRCRRLEADTMLKAIRDFFDTALASGDRADRHTIEVATAALLVEISRMDGEITADERAAVLAAVRGKFGLTGDEAQKLVDLAEAEARQANDYYQFTSIITRRFSREQRIRVVELLWEVALRRRDGQSVRGAPDPQARRPHLRRSRRLHPRQAEGARRGRRTHSASRAATRWWRAAESVYHWRRRRSPRSRIHELVPRSSRPPPSHCSSWS